MKYRNFAIGLIIILVMFILGGFFYADIENKTLLESFYYVIMSITTVGAYTAGPETESGLILTILLVLFGMGVMLYVMMQAAEIIVEGRLRHVLGSIRGEFARMRKDKNHTIVCGYTNLGKYVCESLKENKEPLLIVERNAELASKLAEEGNAVLQGDPLNTEVLLKTNIKKAKALVATLDEDSENLYLIMTANELNPNLILAAKASEDSAVKRLHKVGAQIVVRPEVVGGRQLVSTLLKMEEAGNLETISKK